MREHITGRLHLALIQIAEELNAAGLRTPRGRRWTKNHVRKLLASLDLPRRGMDRVKRVTLKPTKVKEKSVRRPPVKRPPVSSSRRRLIEPALLELAHLSGVEIAEEMNRRGIPRIDNKPWRSETVSRQYKNYGSSRAQILRLGRFPNPRRARKLKPQQL